MTPGQLARRALGPAFQPVGEAYRRVFVDMDKVTDWMVGHIPSHARVLDVGGGDGYVVNQLLTKRSDIRVTMTDLADSIGGFIGEDVSDRVTLLPATSIEAVTGLFNVVTLADVCHHVSPEARPHFFAAVARTARLSGAQTILVKDILPGGLRANLAKWGDWYITGDRQVRQLTPNDIVFPGYVLAETAMPDHPNYGAVFRAVSAETPAP